MDSNIGLIIQIAGVSLITLLTLFLRRSINVIALKHWTNAWLFLTCSLFSLQLAFRFEQYSLQLISLYFLTEYVFGFLLVAGCKSLSGNSELPLRQELFVLPFIVVAFGLPFLSDDLDLVFNVHSLNLAGFFLIAVIALLRTKIRTFGWKVMIVGLTLLALNSVQYFALFAARRYVVIHPDYLAFNPVIDVVLQILLGFGMVLVLLEQVLAEAKLAHESLKRAHDNLEELAHVDPLTTALNRHAFYGYLKRRGNENETVHGSIGFFDIDDLKKVNDIHGHNVGDMVIRSVVRAIRDIIRAEDLLFRWGGDEFFVIMIGLDANTGSMRMQCLSSMLTGIKVDGVDRPLSIGVSHAFEDFTDLADLESTIKRADAGMYRQKQIRKGLSSGESLLYPQPMMASEALRAE